MAVFVRFYFRCGGPMIMRTSISSTSGRPFARVCRLGLGGVVDQFLQPVLRRAGVLKGARTRQCTQLLLDVPRCPQLAGRVIEIEDFLEPVPTTSRERLTRPEQQPPVGSDPVCGASAPALGFLS